MSKEAPKDAKGKADAKPAVVVPAPPPKPLTPLETLHSHITILEKFIETRDARFLTRVLRYSGHVRKTLPTEQLKTAIQTYVLDAPRAASLLDVLAAVAEKRVVASGAPKVPSSAPSSSAMEDGETSAPSTAAAVAPASAPPAVAAAVPAVAAAEQTRVPKPSATVSLECDAYFTSLLLTEAARQGLWTVVAAAAAAAVAAAASSNRRTLHFFAARALSWLAFAHERLGTSAAIRAQLVAAHRTACLHADEYGQAVALNLLLRSYIAADEYALAQALVVKATFPEAASAAQFARYLYYRGRIYAVQLEYSDAHKALVQAVRKAPSTAVGFRVAATKLSCVVQLLMGEIPDRVTFNTPDLAAALRPYLALTSAVRLGNLRAFGDVVRAHTAVFARDRTLSLIRRLDANVIKTGLRKLAASYSRISFVDVAAKLQLGSSEDAEFLCAKAIRDGVIDAVLDHDAGTLASRDAGNVYLTREPQEAFHKRIQFLLDVHNEAVKGMRYPPGALRADLESAEALREREKEEAALVQDIEDGKLDDDDEGMDD